MRTLFVVFYIFLISVGSPAQQNCAAQESNETDSTRLVKHIMQYPPNFSVSFIEKQLNRLGDEISIALIRTLGEKDLSNPEIVKNKVLPMLRSAFASPEMIVAAENRNPKVTLFLLNYLKDKVEDTNLKVEIDDLAKFVNEQTAHTDK